jgi:hypothetical protein
MRIAGVGGATISATTRRNTPEAPEADAPQTESRALIAIEAPRPSEHTTPSAHRPAAAFLAQLIATQMQAPQTRARRRAEPEEAIAVYRSMTKPVAQRRTFGVRV